MNTKAIELWNNLESQEDKEILTNAIMSIVYLIEERNLDCKKTLKHIKKEVKFLTIC